MVLLHNNIRTIYAVFLRWYFSIKWKAKHVRGSPSLIGSTNLSSKKPGSGIF